MKRFVELLKSTKNQNTYENQVKSRCYVLTKRFLVFDKIYHKNPCGKSLYVLHNYNNKSLFNITNRLQLRRHF